MLVLISALACTPPPPAPEGLDESARYMVREFYSSDASYQAGLQGFLAWYEAEGVALVGQEADASTSETFTVAYLAEEDIALLPLSEEIVLDGEADTRGPRDIQLAAGVISLAEMQCDWTEAEAFLVRPDQDAVFNGDWEAYDRTYVSSRQSFEQATGSGEFAVIEEDLDPFADGYDVSATASTLLFTENRVDPTQVLFADLPTYDLFLDLRHGVYEIDGEELGVLGIITYQKDAVWDDGGQNGLVQTYSVELNVERPGGLTLRMLAVWAQPVGAGIDPDDPLVLTYAVNKSLDSSERMSAICSGEEEIGE